MSRRWTILLAVVAVVAVLLALNAIAVDNETKPAEVTVSGGEILDLSGGDVQVWEDRPVQAAGRTRAPIALIHCYSCSLHWWDRLAPLLSERRRVIRLDLLGHGGSEKPQSGYSMRQQGALVAEALNRLDVEGAVVVGHSLGATVATALAEQSSELVDRVVNVDQAPDDSFGSPPLIARLGYVPVIGELLARITPSFVVRDGYGDAFFAPGFDMDAGFENPDQVVDDFRAMTYTSFDESAAAEEEYTNAIPLDQRLASAAVPLLVIFGSEDQIYDADETLAAFEDVPGARTELIEGAGHSPSVEKPAQTAELILEFARGANTATATARPP